MSYTSRSVHVHTYFIARASQTTMEVTRHEFFTVHTTKSKSVKVTTAIPLQHCSIS